jgi:hypothetical protein
MGQCDDLGLFVRRGKGGQDRGDDLLDEDQGPMARAADGLSADADADAASSSEVVLIPLDNWRAEVDRCQWPLVFSRIQRIHKSTAMGDTGSWLGDGAMAQTVCVLSMGRSASGWWRLRPTATGHESTSSGRASWLPQRIRSRRSTWRNASASVDRRCGAGNSVLPKRGVEGLLRDKTRKPGKPPIAADKRPRWWP